MPFSQAHHSPLVRVLVGEYGATHFQAMVPFTGELYFGRPCHDTPQPKRRGGEV